MSIYGLCSKDKQLAQAVLEKRLNLENLRRREMDVEEEASAGGHESRVETSRHLSNANQTANTVRALVQHAFKLTSGDLLMPVDLHPAMLWHGGNLLMVCCGLLWVPH